MKNRVVRALAGIFVIALGVGGINLGWTAYEVGHFRAQILREQAEQHRQGERVLRLLCGSFGKLAALRPPAGNPRTNPSRGYLQDEHAALSQIGPDIGCGGQR